MAFDRQGAIAEATRQLQKVLTKKGESIRTFGRREFVLWGHKTISQFAAERFRGRPGLFSRTGDLWKSFVFRSKQTAGNEVIGEFFTRSKYARIHEYGGTIKAKPERTLAIPFPGGPAETQPGKTTHQAARYTSPLKATLPKHVKFFIAQSQKGNFLLFGKEGKSKKDTRLHKKQAEY